MNVQIIEEAIREYIKERGTDIRLCLRGGPHIKKLSRRIADRLKVSWQKDFAEAYQQGRFDAMQNMKELYGEAEDVFKNVYKEDT